MDPFQIYVGIFDDVVEQAGGNGIGVHAELGQEEGDCQWVLNVRLTRFAKLTGVGLVGYHVGALDGLPNAVAPSFGRDVFYHACNIEERLFAHIHPSRLLDLL
jgi:hypothetical protein